MASGKPGAVQALFGDPRAWQGTPHIAIKRAVLSTGKRRRAVLAARTNLARCWRDQAALLPANRDGLRLDRSPGQARQDEGPSLVQGLNAVFILAVVV